MLVAHESPLALLDISRTYNDYDYCLVHLLPQYSQYLKFFEESKKLGRKIILDNSMFELREAFDVNEFAKWIKRIKPDEYIVPDVYKDAQKTMESFISWEESFNDIKGKKIGVVQGETYQELIDCYKFMSEHADKISFSFECPYFGIIGHSDKPNHTHWELFMRGRQEFIKDLIRDNIWNWSKPHHLLGCCLPQEFIYYVENVSNIESIDTSNPVVAGMHNVRYNENGLTDKITTKLADLINEKITNNHLFNVIYNIIMFRIINKIDWGFKCQE